MPDASLMLNATSNNKDSECGSGFGWQPRRQGFGPEPEEPQDVSSGSSVAKHYKMSCRGHSGTMLLEQW